MKTHARNLLFASLVYLGVFIGIVLVSMLMGIGVDVFSDEGPDTLIFIGSVFFTFLASHLVYLGFYLSQRLKVRNDPNIGFLGLMPRIIWGIIAAALSCGVLFLCLRWTADGGEEISILLANISLAGVIAGLTLAVDLVSFILFKPRV